MKRPIKRALLVLLGITLVGVLIVIVIAGNLWWSMTHDFIDQSDGPTSRAQAVTHCGIPLPPSAHHVEYASLAGGLQEGDFWVRFEAPVPECYSAAQAVFAKWSMDSHRLIPEFRSVSNPLHEGSTRLRTSWFDVERISQGVVAGSGYGWEPRIWIDAEHGVFYYHVAD